MFVDKHSGDIACKDCGIVVKERKRKRNKTRLPPIKNDYKLRHKSRTLSLEEMNDLQDFVGKLSRKSHRKKSPKKKSDKKKSDKKKNKRLLSAKKLQAWYRNLSPKKKKKLQPFTYKDSHNQRYYVDAKGNVEKIGDDSYPRGRAQVFADVFGSARMRRPKKKKKSAKKKKKSAKKKKKSVKKKKKLSARQKLLKMTKKLFAVKKLQSWHRKWGERQSTKRKQKAAAIQLQAWQRKLSEKNKRLLAAKKLQAWQRKLIVKKEYKEECQKEASFKSSKIKASFKSSKIKASFKSSKIKASFKSSKIKASFKSSESFKS